MGGKGGWGAKGGRRGAALLDGRVGQGGAGGGAVPRGKGRLSLGTRPVTQVASAPALGWGVVGWGVRGGARPKGGPAFRVFQSRVFFVIFT